MVSPADDPSTDRSRRALLTGMAGGLAATSGCVSRLRTVMGRQQPTQVSITIKTVPSDDDPFALLLARQIAGWFGAAGIDAEVQPMAGEELLRQVAVNGSYDVFVGRFPVSHVTPDLLYGLLHSRFGPEPGWQNPFGYADLSVDDLLDQQRTENGGTRERTVEELQETVARSNPFTLLAFPDDVRTVRTDRFDGFDESDLSTPLGVLGIRQSDASATELGLTTTDERVTSNLNPLLATVHDRSMVTGLVYDSLARRYGDELLPWLAESWEWDDRGAFEVTLRDDLEFHDGSSLTAADVAFTYQFLSDTSLDESEQAAPTMRYRGRSTLVEAAEADGPGTVTLDVGSNTRRVAERALTVPILPRDHWRDRTGDPTVGGLDLGAGSTEALVTNNLPPVGSGPLAFSDAARNDRLVLERFDDHFLHRTETPDLPDRIADGVAFDRLVLTHAGSDSAAVEMVSSGTADCTLTGLGPDVIGRIGRNDDLDLLIEPSPNFYFLGFNTERAPMAKPQFRNLLAHLVDRNYLVRSIFSTLATPAVTPLAATDWAAPELVWNGEDPISPFFGTAGNVDEQEARTAFREAGFEYDEQGRLLGG